jgi:hypothetical protein
VFCPIVKKAVAEPPIITMAIIITSETDFLLVLAGRDLCFTNLHYRIWGI